MSLKLQRIFFGWLFASSLIIIFEVFIRLDWSAHKALVASAMTLVLSTFIVLNRIVDSLSTDVTIQKKDRLIMCVSCIVSILIYFPLMMI